MTGSFFVARFDVCLEEALIGIVIGVVEGVRDVDHHVVLTVPDARDTAGDRIPVECRHGRVVFVEPYDRRRVDVRYLRRGHVVVLPDNDVHLVGDQPLQPKRRNETLFGWA